MIIGMSVSFDPLVYFDDDRADREKVRGRFLDGEMVSPVFDYPKLDELYDSLAEQKHALERAMRVAGNEALEDIYARELAEIHLVEAAQKLREQDSPENRESFMALNRRIFGDFRRELFVEILDGSYVRHLDEELIKRLGRVARERFSGILWAVPETDETMKYDAEAIVYIANMAFSAEGLVENGWKAEINELKSVSTIDSGEKVLWIPRSLRRNAEELRRLLIHEIGVHARRAQNAEESEDEVLKLGEVDYLPAEEGLGILLECAVVGNYDNPSFMRVVERYIVAGLALGADGEKPRNAAQTFAAAWPEIAKLLSKSEEEKAGLIEEAKEKAYAHVENAFRGTNLRMPGVIFMRLKIYYEGLLDNIEYFERGGDLEMALRGKYNHTRLVS